MHVSRHTRKSWHVRASRVPAIRVLTVFPRLIARKTLHNSMDPSSILPQDEKELEELMNLLETYEAGGNRLGPVPEELQVSSLLLPPSAAAVLLQLPCL